MLRCAGMDGDLCVKGVSDQFFLPGLLEGFGDFSPDGEQLLPFGRKRLVVPRSISLGEAGKMDAGFFFIVVLFVVRR